MKYYYKEDTVQTHNLEVVVKAFCNAELTNAMICLYEIAAESHIYINKWREITWSPETIQKIIKISHDYDLVGFQLKGKGIWLILMILENGFTNSQFLDLVANHLNLINNLIEILFRYIVEHPNHSQCIMILSHLVNKCPLSWAHIYKLACKVIHHLPNAIQSDNFVALLNLTSRATMEDSKILIIGLRLLSSLCPYLTYGVTQYHLSSQSFPLIQMCLEYTNKDLSSLSEPEKESVFDVVLSCVYILKMLVSCNPLNNDYIDSKPWIINMLFKFVKPSISQLPPPLIKEIFSFFSVLSSQSHNKHRIKFILSVPVLFEIIQQIPVDNIEILDILSDLYLILYESHLSYLDHQTRYVLIETKHFHHIQIIRCICSNTIALGNQYLNNKDEFKKIHQNPGVVFQVIARIFARFERILNILTSSNPLLDVKLQLIKLLNRLFGPSSSDFDEWDPEIIAMLELAILLLKNQNGCWDRNSIDPIDKEFVFISKQLIETYGDITNDTIHDSIVTPTSGSKKSTKLDARDLNMLYFLIGKDNISTIPQILSSECFMGPLNSNSRSSSFQNLSSNLNRTLSQHSLTPSQSPSHSYETGKVYESANSTVSNSLSKGSSPISPNSDFIKSTSSDFRPVSELQDQINKYNEYFTFCQSLFQNLIKQFPKFYDAYIPWIDKELRPIPRSFYSSRSESQGKPSTDGPVDKSKITLSVEKFRMVSYFNFLLNSLGLEEIRSYIEDLESLIGWLWEEIRIFYQYLYVQNSATLLPDEFSSEYMTYTQLLIYMRLCLQSISVFISEDGPFLENQSLSELIINGILSYRPILLFENSYYPISSTEIAINCQLPLIETLSWNDWSKTKYFQSYYNNSDLLYTSIQCLFHVAQSEQSIRRKLVKTLVDVIENLYFIAPGDAINSIPVLILLEMIVEYFPKFEYDMEESAVRLLMRTIRSTLFYVVQKSAQIIALIGQESPGFVYRGLSRNEVEFPIIHLLRKQVLSSNNDTQPTNNLLVISLLKACVVLIHNYNIKPRWFPAYETFHFSSYSNNATNSSSNTSQHQYSHRALLHHEVIHLLTIRLLSSVSVEYRVLCFSHVLALLSSFMYAVHDEMIPNFTLVSANRKTSSFSGTPSKSPITTTGNTTLSLQLREYLIQSFLPYLPVAIDMIMLTKRKIFPFLDLNVLNQKDSLGNKFRETVNLSPRDASYRRSAINASFEDQFQTINLKDFLVCTIKLELNEADAILLPNIFRQTFITDNICKSSPTKEVELPPSIPQENSPESGHNFNNFYNLTKLPAIEALTERTMEGLFSFLCTDTMFPLSTYIRYVQLFDNQPIIAAITNFMLDNRTNAKLLRRGIDIIKYFAENQVNLSSIAMHSPPALLVTASMYHDNSEVKLIFLKVLLIILKLNDDFAKDNLLRFHIHVFIVQDLLNQPLQYYILHHNNSSTPSSSSSNSFENLIKYSIQCIIQLITNEQIATTILDQTQLVPVLFQFIDYMSHDIAILYYVVKCMIVLNYFVPNMLAKYSNHSTQELVPETSSQSHTSSTSSQKHPQSQNQIAKLKLAKKLLLKLRQTLSQASPGAGAGSGKSLFSFGLGKSHNPSDSNKSTKELKNTEVDCEIVTRTIKKNSVHHTTQVYGTQSLKSSPPVGSPVKSSKNRSPSPTPVPDTNSQTNSVVCYNVYGVDCDIELYELDLILASSLWHHVDSCVIC